MRKADVGLQFADTIKLGFSGSNFRQREPAAPEYFPQQKPAPGDQDGLSWTFRVPAAEMREPEKNLMGNPNDPIDRENAALDRMVKSICRGC
jgi:hypothetical protein